MHRHDLDPVSLTFGFAFTGLGLLFLLGRIDQALRLGWVWPLLLFALGAGILLDLARGRARTDPAPTTADPDPGDGPDPGPGNGPDPGPGNGTHPEAKPAVDNRRHPS